MLPLLLPSPSYPANIRGKQKTRRPSRRLTHHDKAQPTDQSQTSNTCSNSYTPWRGSPLGTPFPRERHVALLEGDARREPCFFCHRLPSPLRSGPTMLHRLSLVWPQVRPRDPPPWDTVASCCAPFLLCICRRRSRVSEGGDATVSGGLLWSRFLPAASAPPVRRAGRRLHPPGALPQPRRPKHYL